MINNVPARFLNAEAWSLWQAAYLLCNLAPRSYRDFLAHDRDNGGPVADMYADLKNAVTVRSLPCINATGKFPGVRVLPSDAVAWALGRGMMLPPELAELAAAAPQAAPVEAVSISGESAGPLPLTTGDIAFCFAGLRWKTEDEWKKPLGDKPKWLDACVHTPGVRGVSETRWNPVCIGAALVRNGHAKANSIRSRFQTKPLLIPWLDAWKTYEADNLDTD